MYEEKEAELDRHESLDALEEERDVAKTPFSILSTAGLKISKQRSTGQDLQRWRTRSTPAGEEKGQTQAQMGGSLHN